MSKLQSENSQFLKMYLESIAVMANHGFKQFKVSAVDDIEPIGIVTKITVDFRKGKKWKYVGMTIYPGGEIREYSPRAEDI